MLYSILTFRQISPRKLELIDMREDLNAAQLGGVIAHALDDCDSFKVYEKTTGSVMTFNKRGI